MSSPPVVHLVDDDASFLSATARLLRANGFAVKAFHSAEEFLAQLSKAPHGCVIADVHMPGLTGLDLQEAMARTIHGLPVIFLTGQGEISTSVRAMKNGAEDFLEKRGATDHLLNAVKRALVRAANERKQRTRQQQLTALFDSLSVREREVLTHVVQGKLNKQIAADLGISERTVKAHRTAVTAKLGVPSVAELTRLVQESGLFEEKQP